jgi:hypothetical protein
MLYGLLVDKRPRDGPPRTEPPAGESLATHPATGSAPWIAAVRSVRTLLRRERQRKPGGDRP